VATMQPNLFHFILLCLLSSTIRDFFFNPKRKKMIFSNLIFWTHPSRRVSILVLASFLGIKSSITAISVTELFIPEKSEGHVQKAGLDFWFFAQENQMESVRFREK
jgi:hypothetical protein